MQNLPEQLVSEFLNAHRESGAYLGRHIARLTELAIAEDPETARTATKAIFASLIERLADSFEPAAVSLYNRAFAQVIQFCRANAQAGTLDRALKEFGLANEHDLITRAESLRRVTKLSALATPRRIQRVIVLSRVTLGADVAITSVIIERMKQSFPDAEIVLVGGEKSSQLFGGDPRLRFSEISYRRTATLTERLLTWTALLECIDDLTRGLDPGEYVIVDPDTRLTQLGLMPVARESRGDDVDATARSEYVFFPSREYGSSTSRSLGELTSAWLDEVFGESVEINPRVSLPGEDHDIARNVVGKMNSDRARPIVAINFGVGENPLKRVGGDFEESVAARLIQEGAGIVLDKGFGEDETARADGLIAKLARIERDGRVRAVEISEQNLKSVSEASALENLDCDILVWNGRIGLLAALIGESDLYIGYDSAGAHLAAALGVPCIDVFAGFISPRMLDRWSPAGKAETRIVAAETLNGVVSCDSLVETVLRYAGKSLKSEVRGPKSGEVER